jgi:hypothetical protein
MRWLPSLPRITYLSKLPGIRSIAAFVQHELFGYKYYDPHPMLLFKMIDNDTFTLIHQRCFGANFCF